jgi:hypothetical protein
MISSRNAPPYVIALAYVGLGENDEAFKWLDGALQEPTSPRLQ